jgi:putative DNA primase/helicase
MSTPDHIWNDPEAKRQHRAELQARIAAREAEERRRRDEELARRIAARKAQQQAIADPLTTQAAVDYRREQERPSGRTPPPAGAQHANGKTTHVATRPRVELIPASSLKPEPVNWLWPGWLARGKVHILGGQPGAGKTTLAVAIAAVVTKGGRLPDGSHAPLGNVVIWSGEDDPADTLLPRLLSSGADANRVFFVGGVARGEERRPFDPSKDVAGLCEAIERAGGCKFLIVDPVVSAVAADSHKNADTRRALQPLVDLAASANAALLGITHLSKGTSGREPVERITGSIAFGALARVVMIAAKENESESEKGAPPRRFLARAKSNIGPDDGGFAYELRQEPMPGDDRIIASIAVFGAAIEGTARDLLSEVEDEEKDQGAAREAEDLLGKLLAEGPVAVNELKRAANAHGISPSSLRRAKAKLKIAAQKTGMKGGWEWSLGQSAEGAQTHRPNAEGAHEDANPEHLRKTPRFSGHSGRLAPEDALQTESEHLRRAFPEDAQSCGREHLREGNGLKATENKGSAEDDPLEHLRAHLREGEHLRKTDGDMIEGEL